MENLETLARCPACGDIIDYCQGHGDIGDPSGAWILACHEDGDHELCHPVGCADAGTEPARFDPAQHVAEWVIDARVGPVVGRYHGGAYIDIYHEIAIAHEVEPEPIATVNVWDHEAGKPGIDPTPAAVLAQVSRWLRDAIIAGDL